jgi:hypothetical protein
VSNFLAVATVTAALQRVLQRSVEADVAGAKVLTERPDATKTGPVVNMFLYEVQPNASLRNADLPTRRNDATVVQRPCIALDLHYLLTFHGNDKELEPQRLLGSTVRTLHARPLVTRALVQAVVAAAGGGQPEHPALAGTDLADAAELPRMAPLPLDLEELSRLWSVFFQTPYVLSAAWSATPVLIDSSETALLPAPVITPVLGVSPLRRPRIERVEVADEPSAPLTAGTTWRITGTQLRGDHTLVRIGGVDVSIVSATATQLDVEADPVAALRAGSVAVEVKHRALLGEPAEPRGDIASTVRTVRLAPRVLSATADADIVTVTIDVPVRVPQRVALRLLAPATGAVERLLPVGDRDADTTSVTAPRGDVSGGDYAVVVSVDRVDSPLHRADDGHIEAPLVTLP